jgi:hypothetical protein
MSKPIPVSFPPHLFPPAGVQGIDIAKNCDVEAATPLTDFMFFTCPQGAQAIFIGYALTNDGLYSADTQFLPLVDGARVMPFHGDPQNNYKLSLGHGPDLSDSYLKQIYIILNPGQTFLWRVANASTVKAIMGVRLKGYFNSSVLREPPRFG